MIGVNWWPSKGSRRPGGIAPSIWQHASVKQKRDAVAQYMEAGLYHLPADPALSCSCLVFGVALHSDDADDPDCLTDAAPPTSSAVTATGCCSSTAADVTAVRVGRDDGNEDGRSAAVQVIDSVFTRAHGECLASRADHDQRSSCESGAHVPPGHPSRGIDSNRVKSSSRTSSAVFHLNAKNGTISSQPQLSSSSVRPVESSLSLSPSPLPIAPSPQLLSVVQKSNVCATKGDATAPP